MAVISILRKNGNNTTKARQSVLKNIGINKTNYHFAKANEVVGGVCANAVNEPIIDMEIQGNSIQSLLPSEYQAVEYIQSSGTQYIDTGVIPNQDTRVIVDFQLTKLTSAFICGARESASLKAYTLNMGIVNGKCQLRSIFGGQTHTLSADFNTERCVIDKDGVDVYINNVYKVTHQSTNFTSPGSLYIFACNQANTTGGYLPDEMKLYSFKMYNNGTLTRDYIPCFRKSDNAAGLYDVVNDKFYTNAGTGTFSVGADIESIPSLEQPIEIKSVGVKTKNLVDIPIIDKATGTVNNIPCYIDKTFSFSCQEYPTLIANDSGVETSIWRISLKKLDGSIVYVVDNGLSRKDSSITKIIVTADNPIVSMSYRNTYIKQGAYKNIQFEYGEEITDFEPYGYKIPIKVIGKNLFNINNITATSITKNEDGSLTVSGYPVSTGQSLGKLCPNLKAGQTITFSINTDGLDYIFLKNLSSGAQASWANGGNYEITEEMLKRQVYLYKKTPAQGSGNATIKSIQIELGKTVTPYEPYVEPTTTNIYLKEPLRKINDVADVVDYKNKKVIRNIGSVIYNATESWSKYDSGNGYMETNSIFPDGKPVLCNIFVNSTTLIKTLAIRKNYANIYVYGVQDYYPTQAEWHAFLAANNMEVIGQLVTPTEESISIEEIETLDGTTTFEVETSIDPSAVKVKYWKQI